MMGSVTRSLHWPMGHRLSRHLGGCRFPHGHGWVAEVTVRGMTEQAGASQGMIIDFGELDRILRKVIQPWDHAFMVETGDPFLTTLRLFETETSDTKIIEVPWTPTSENIAAEIVRQLAAWGLRDVSVRVSESPNSWADAHA